MFLFTFVFFFSSFILWWMVFLLTSLCFFFILKEEVSFGVLLNYFLLQEALGLFFIAFFSISSPLLVLFLKVGVSPFFFWVLWVSFFLEGVSFFWFLSFQKLPFTPLFFFFLEGSFSFLLLGLFLCFLCLFFFFDMKSILVISSSESFNWLLLCSFFFFSFFLFVFFFYLLFFFFLLMSAGGSSLEGAPLEVSIVFLNFPLGASFFVKLLVFSQIVGGSFFFLVLILFFMVLSGLGVCRILFFFLMSSSFCSRYSFFSSFFLVFPLGFLLFF